MHPPSRQSVRRSQTPFRDYTTSPLHALPGSAKRHRILERTMPAMACCHRIGRHQNRGGVAAVLGHSLGVSSKLPLPFVQLNLPRRSLAKEGVTLAKTDKPRASPTGKAHQLRARAWSVIPNRAPEWLIGSARPTAMAGRGDCLRGWQRSRGVRGGSSPSAARAGPPWPL